MRGRIALARARTPRAADEAQRHAVGLRLLEPVPDRTPRAHVLRLLLHPHDLGEIRIASRQLGRGLDGERVELLEPGDRDVLGARVALAADEVVVDLPRAEHEPPHRLVIGGGIVEERREAPVGEVGEGRGGRLEPQEALRGHHDQRPRGRVERLPAEQVEVLRRGGRVRDPDVLLRRELEEPLEPRARVLGPVALVPVREQDGEPAALAPLREPGDDELVDHDLRAVDEVAELRLPEHERLRRGDRVPVLEAEAGELRERRVRDLERRGGAVQVLHRHVRRARVQVVEDEVAVREGAALGVLPGEPDRDPLAQERAVRERLGLAPVDPALVERLDAPLELPRELRVDGEAVRHPQQLGVELAQARGRDPGRRRPRRRRTAAAPRAPCDRRRTRSAGRRGPPSSTRPPRPRAPRPPPA